MNETCECGHVQNLHSQRQWDCMAFVEDSESGMCECLEFRAAEESSS